MQMETKSLDELKPNPKNPRFINKHDYDHLVQSIKRFGDLSGIVFNTQTNQLVGGHQRIQAFKTLGGIPTISERYETTTSTGTTAIGYVLLNDEKYSYREVAWNPDIEISANVAANRIQGEFDKDLLAELVYEINQLANGSELIDLMGLAEDEVNKLLAQVSGEGEEEKAGNLSEKFIVPPFSILDTKQGYWQSRKRAWLDIGLKSELGREGALLYASATSTDAVSKMLTAGGGTSVFDPVLCELVYRWFNVPNGTVLDTFAGGSVRGVIASKLGQQYTGIELRGEQVEANRVQGNDLCTDTIPVWIEGDSLNTPELTGGVEYDLFFSCPPYADLEVYSDKPQDLSNMDYESFLPIYKDIIKKGCNQLKANRFAVFVIGEVRGKKGAYYNFVGDTVTAFKEAGLSYYNEIILVNTVSTLALPAVRQFNATRKIGKQHQNVLVFYKGDLKAINGNYPELDFSDLEDMFKDELLTAGDDTIVTLEPVESVDAAPIA